MKLTPPALYEEVRRSPAAQVAMGCLSRSLQVVLSQRVSGEAYAGFFPQTTPEQLTKMLRVLTPDMARLQINLQDSLKGSNDAMEFAHVQSGRAWIALQMYVLGPAGPDGTPAPLLLEEWVFECEYDPAPRQGGPSPDDARKAVSGMRQLATMLCLTSMQEVHSIVSATTGSPGNKPLEPLHEFWTRETYQDALHFPDQEHVEVRRVQCTLLNTAHATMGVTVTWRTDALPQYAAAAAQAQDRGSEFGAASAAGSGPADGGAHREYGAAVAAPIRVQLDYFDESQATDAGSASAALATGGALSAGAGERPPAPASTAPVIPIAAGHPAPSASSTIEQGGRPRSLGLLSHQGPSSHSSAHRSSPEHGRSLPADAAHAMPDVTTLHLDAARAVSRDSTNVHIMDQPPSPPRGAASATALFAGAARRPSMSLPGVGTPLADQLITPEVNVSVTTSAESSASSAHSDPSHIILGGAEQPACVQQSLAVSDLSYATPDVDGHADADIVTPASCAASRAHSAFSRVDSPHAIESSAFTTGSPDDAEDTGDWSAVDAQAQQQQQQQQQHRAQPALHAEAQASSVPAVSTGQSASGHASGNAPDDGGALCTAGGSSSSRRSSQDGESPASHSQAHVHARPGAAAAAQAAPQTLASEPAAQLVAPTAPACTRAEAARQLLAGIPSDFVLSTTWDTHTHDELAGTLTVL